MKSGWKCDIHDGNDCLIVIGHGFIPLIGKTVKGCTLRYTVRFVVLRLEKSSFQFDQVRVWLYGRIGEGVLLSGFVARFLAKSDKFCMYPASLGVFNKYSSGS
jgi:hypothetical protein